MHQRYAVQIVKGTRNVRRGRFLSSKGMGLTRTPTFAELYTLQEARDLTFSEVDSRVEFKIVPVTVTVRS